MALFPSIPNLLSAVPPVSPSSVSSLLPKWIKGGVRATLFLQTMHQPKHGTLQVSSDHNWVFSPGKNSTNESIPLPNFEANCQQLLDTVQLFQGHTKFRNVYTARSQVSLRDSVLRHVSAHGLQSLLAPSSLKAHAKLHPSDKVIWDEAYNEEYDGLVLLPSWEIVSEDEYIHLSKGKKALPTMAIATIKYDEHNRPKQAKYHLVVLGNLDYHTWSKADTSAPVLSQLELRLLTSLAIFNKRVLKNCDVKQAFMQSTLPVDETYFLKPPAGCPRSKPNHYWRLIRSLYGLKRAPRIWFDTLCSHLCSLGLQNSPTSPCLFIGHPIDGGPPIYVGIYVDDIIYFSSSDAVERKFEESLGKLVTVEFMGQVSHFLGIKFSWKHHNDGHLTVNLTQQSFVETLIDSILEVEMSSTQRDLLRLQYQSLVGSLNWLAHTTCPDLSTVVSLLTQHQNNPSPGHLEAAKYLVKYLAGTKTLGIYFTSRK
jgi:hypothetical protein